MKQAGAVNWLALICRADALLEIDPEQPYESMARRAVGTFFNGSAVRRIEGAIRCAKQARADGVIVFCHWGCKQTLGLSQLGETNAGGAGHPTLACWTGTVVTPATWRMARMVTRVNAFLEQLEGTNA